MQGTPSVTGEGVEDASSWAPSRWHSRVVGSGLLAYITSDSHRLHDPSVTDSDGRGWGRTGVGQHSMRASLETTALGLYDVEWKTVSPWTVAVCAAPSGSAWGSPPPTSSRRHDRAPRQRPAAGRGSRSGVRGPADRGGGDAGGPSRPPPPATGLRPRATRTGLSVALAVGLFVVMGEALLAALSPTAAAVARYLSQSSIPRLVRLAAVTSALAACAWAPEPLRPARRSWPWRRWPPAATPPPVPPGGA